MNAWNLFCPQSSGLEQKRETGKGTAEEESSGLERDIVKNIRPG